MGLVVDREFDFQLSISTELRNEGGGEKEKKEAFRIDRQYNTNMSRASRANGCRVDSTTESMYGRPQGKKAKKNGGGTRCGALSRELI